MKPPAYLIHVIATVLFVLVFSTNSFSKEMGLFKITAYCPCAKCCKKYTGITASGSKAKVGIVAADWRVLPKNQRIEIKGLGKYLVKDKGSVIKGKRLDVYFDTHDEALEFGVKKLRVVMIK